MTKIILLCFVLFYSGNVASKEKETIVYCTYPEHHNGQKVTLTATLSNGTYQVIETEIRNNTAIFSLPLQEPCPAYILSDNNTAELHLFLDVPYIEIVIDEKEIENSLIYESESTKHWINTRNRIRNWNLKRDTLLNEQPVSLSNIQQSTYLTDSLDRCFTEYIKHEIKLYPDNPVSWYLFMSYMDHFSFKQINSLIHLLKHFAGNSSYAVISQKLNKSLDAKTYKHLALPTLKGEIFRFSSLKSKYILIGFCLASSLVADTLHNELMPFYNDYRHKGLEVVSVFEDYMITHHLEKIRQAHLPWITLISDASITSLDSKLGFVRIPGTILLNSNFEVVLQDASFTEITSFLEASL